MTGLHDQEREQRALTAFVEHRADGIIVASCVSDPADVLARVRADRVVFVQPDYPALADGAEPPARGVVRTDDSAGVAATVRHLVERGYRRLAYAGPSGLVLQRVAASGRDRHRRGARARTAPLHRRRASTRGAMPRRWPGALAADPPDAVLCYDDKLALGLLDALRSTSLVVPDDLAVVGFDGIPAARQSWPRLTTVEVPSVDVGRHAVEMLIASVRDGRDARLGGPAGEPRDRGQHAATRRRGCGSRGTPADGRRRARSGLMTQAGAAPAIELVNVTKRYGDAVALDGVSLQIESGEFFCLLGPSGCGKTTTLNLIGGFIPLTSGELRIEGRRVNDLPPHQRDVNTVFQNYALFPHMSVADNVAFGLRMEGLADDEIGQRVGEYLELVGLAEYRDRYPGQLSGGQAQRVALARALAKRPAVLLLDEPLGALDLKLRKQMQVELSRIHRQVGTTFVFVTHDQEEALSMATRIAVMAGGHVRQIGSPREIYQGPVDRFVADFIGESNFLDGRVAEDGRGRRLPAEQRDGRPDADQRRRPRGTVGSR